MARLVGKNLMKKIPNHKIKVKNGKYFFLAMHSLSLLTIVFSSGAAAMVSLYSSWGLRNEPWHG
jgi:hypothetical protein